MFLLYFIVLVSFFVIFYQIKITQLPFNWYELESTMKKMIFENC